MNSSKQERNIIVFVINPGSTSTKVALYDHALLMVSESIAHSTQEIQRYGRIVDQYEFRLALVRNFLERRHCSCIHAVAGRGGLLRPIPSGIYRIDKEMLDDCRSGRFGEHASNLGALLADAIGEQYHCPAFVADPVVVDEMDPVARISGIPDIERKSIFHALNQKSAARTIARQLGKPYEICSLIVAHMGGGISIGCHKNGRVIDVNNALGGEGPFSPERAGGLPVTGVIDLLQNQRYSFEQLRKRLIGNGGLVAYCGTNDLKEIRNGIRHGDERAALIFEALAYQVSKEIAQHGATLEGKVDAIILTGGMAYDTHLIEAVRKRISFLAPVFIVPGEREMEALMENALRVLLNQQIPRTYGVQGSSEGGNAVV